MMPPTKSNAGKTRDAAKGRMGGAACPAKGPLVSGMRSRMVGGAGRQSGVRQVITGMKGSGMKVTGMKGRGPNASKIPFRAVKSTAKKRPAKKISPESILSGNKQQDEALLKLRIPLHICSALPSIRKFTAKSKASKGRKIQNMHFETEAEAAADQEQRNPHLFPCVKKRKTDYIKYTMSILREHRFQGMIWDVAFMADGDIVVTCSEGAMLCDKELAIKKHFENMFLPGAIGFFSDGRILIVDRSSDTVNVYRKNATFIRSFLAGKCPMGMVVNASDEVFVSDTGDKCVRKFDMLGRHLLTIPTRGDEYSLQWPLYLTLSRDQDVFVSDVHQQKVLQFSDDGAFRRVCGLKTLAGSTVLRPHGVCMTRDDELVVIDTSIDTVETFLPNGSFQQTLLNPDDGMALEPKLCKLNAGDGLLVIGGMKGLIRIYELTVNPPPLDTPPPNSHRAGGSAAMLRRSLSRGKDEIKEEPTDY